MKNLFENWNKFLVETNGNKGYKVVAFDGNLFRSLQNPNITYNIKVGSTEVNPQGFFLGTTEKFVRDHYLELTDYDDAIITYEYDPEDIIRGNPDDNGEIKVTKAKVLNVEVIPREDG